MPTCAVRELMSGAWVPSNTNSTFSTGSPKVLVTLHTLEVKLRGQGQGKSSQPDCCSGAARKEDRPTAQAVCLDQAGRQVIWSSNPWAANPPVPRWSAAVPGPHLGAEWNLEVKVAGLLV